MKKNFLIRLTALAAAAMMLLAFTGCDSKPADDTDGQTTTTTAPALTGDAAAFEGLKFEINPDLDLEGREMTIAVWGVVPGRGDSAKYDRRYALYDRTMEKYNVKINWIASNMQTFNQDFSLAFSAGKHYADIMFCPSYNGYQVAKLEGAALALDDYIDYGVSRYEGYADALMYVDGKHYSYMPNDRTANSLGYTITYNTTILSGAGCEDPFELYEQGKWDWDAFTEIVRKTTQVDSEGNITCFGVGGSNLLDALLLSNGVSPIQLDTKNKKFVCGLYTEAGMNALDQLRTILYDIKGADDWYGSHNSALGFKDSKMAMLIGPQYYGGQFVSVGMPIMTVPLPKGPDVDYYVNGLEMAEWWMLPSISNFEPEEVLQVAFDAIRNDPEYEDTYISDEGFRDDFIVQTYDELVFTTEEEAGFFFDFITDGDVKTILGITDGAVQGVLRSSIYHNIKMGENPRTLLDREKPVIEAALNDMLPESLK